MSGTASVARSDARGRVSAQRDQPAAHAAQLTARKGQRSGRLQPRRCAPPRRLPPQPHSKVSNGRHPAGCLPVRLTVSQASSPASVDTHYTLVSVRLGLSLG